MLTMLSPKAIEKCPATKKLDIPPMGLDLAISSLLIQHLTPSHSGRWYLEVFN